MFRVAEHNRKQNLLSDFKIPISHRDIGELCKCSIMFDWSESFTIAMV